MSEGPEAPLRPCVWMWVVWVVKSRETRKESGEDIVAWSLKIAVGITCPRATFVYYAIINLTRVREPEKSLYSHQDSGTLKGERNECVIIGECQGSRSTGRSLIRPSGCPGRLPSRDVVCSVRAVLHQTVP